MTTEQRQALEDYEIELLQTIQNLQEPLGDLEATPELVRTSNPPMTSKEALEKLLEDLNEAAG